MLSVSPNLSNQRSGFKMLFYSCTQPISMFGQHLALPNIESEILLTLCKQQVTMEIIQTSLLVAAQLAPEKSRISKVCEAQSILPLLSFCCSCSFPTWTICEDTSVRVHHSLITWVHSSSAALSNNIVLIALLGLGKVRFPALHCCQLSKWQVSHFPSVPVCHTSLEGKVGGPMGSGGQWHNGCASCVICWAILGMLLSNSVLWCWTFRECSCTSSVLLTHAWNAVKNRKLFHKRLTSLLWEVA